jgi:septal ring factor EnvC (AmiA/AmiB activator)
MASHADLVVEVAWLAAAVALNARQHEAMLGQLRAEHADALANSVESQWRARDAARAEVGRLNAALAQARAEIERLTANALRLRTQVEGLNASLAEARKQRDPPHP